MTKPQRVTIEGVEYDAGTFTPEQSHLLDHCMDLDQKIKTIEFDLQQLQVGKDAFIKMLKGKLNGS